MISLFDSKIVKNIKIAENYYKLSFRWKGEETPKPGQFITIYLGGILRKPFAISSFNKEKKIAEFIYQTIGERTKKLINRNDILNILGPLGNNFLNFINKKKNIIIVAGGIGLGPLLFLYNETKELFPLFIFGINNIKNIPFSLLKNTIICTDDGSEGFKGTVINYLESIKIEKDCIIFSCGPYKMLQACNNFSKKKGIDCFVSMEQIIGCGIGACLGCVIPVKGEKKFERICMEGPVFNSKKVIWKD